MSDPTPPNGPLESLDDWEDFVLERYPKGDALKPYYEDLIAEFFPDTIAW